VWIAVEDHPFRNKPEAEIGRCRMLTLREKVRRRRRQFKGPGVPRLVPPLPVSPRLDHAIQFWKKKATKQHQGHQPRDRSILTLTLTLLEKIHKNHSISVAKNTFLIYLFLATEAS
jgi:hypothetical protein